MSEKTKTINFILIIIFAIVFSLEVHLGIRVAVITLLKIPEDYVGFAQWGDTFFIRIIASLIGTAAGTFVIGTFLKTRAKLSAIIATIPTVIFWIAVLVLGITIVSNEGYSFENIKTMFLLPAILTILTPAVGYHSAGWGQNYFDIFQRPRSVLNIKWYQWLWVLPFYLHKVVAIPVFIFALLVKLDFGYSSLDPSIFDLISNFGYFFARVIILFILLGLVFSILRVASLLSEEKTTAKINWKNGIIILGNVLLFIVLDFFLFGSRY